MFDPVALDDVAGLHVIREDHYLLTHGAARGLEHHGRPVAAVLAHPERESRSVGAGDDVARARHGRELDLLPAPVTLYYDHYTPPEPCPLDLLAQPEQALKLAAVETGDNFIVDDCHRCCPIAELQQLIKSCLVFPDVLVCKGNPLLRKKLFLLVA